MSFQKLALVFWQGDGISSSYWKMAVALNASEYGDNEVAINAFVADISTRIYTRSTQVGLGVPADFFNADGTPNNLEFFAFKFAPNAITPQELDFLDVIYVKFVSGTRYYREYRLAGSQLDVVFNVGLGGTLYGDLTAKSNPASAGGMIQNFRNNPPTDNTSSLDTFLYLSANVQTPQADYETDPSAVTADGYYTSLGFDHDMVALVGFQTLPFLTLYETYIPVSSGCYANINSFLWPGINPSYFNLRAFFQYQDVFDSGTCDQLGNVYDVIFNIVRYIDNSTTPPTITQGGVTDLFSEAYLFGSVVYNYITTLFYQIESPAIGASYLNGNYINYVTAPSTYYVSGDGSHLFQSTSIVYMEGTVPAPPGTSFDNLLIMDVFLIFNGAINTLQDTTQIMQSQLADLSFAFTQPKFLAAFQSAVDTQISTESSNPSSSIYASISSVANAQINASLQSGGSISNAIAAAIAPLQAEIATLQSQINPVLLNAIAKALRISVPATPVI